MEVSGGDVILIWLIALGMSTFLVAALSRLFSINRTLKAILAELRGEHWVSTFESREAPSKVIERIRESK
jgi:hypothetical protein